MHPLPRPKPNPAAQPPFSADPCRPLPPTAKTRAAQPAPGSRNMATTRRAVVSSPRTTSGELENSEWVRLALGHHGQRPRGCGPADRDPPCELRGVPASPATSPLATRGRGTRGWWGRGQPGGVLKGRLRRSIYSLQPFIRWLKEKPKQNPQNQFCRGGV